MGRLQLLVDLVTGIIELAADIVRNVEHAVRLVYQHRYPVHDRIEGAAGGAVQRVARPAQGALFPVGSGAVPALRYTSMFHHRRSVFRPRQPS